ncbi:MAG: carboxypeptidase regulatory-like domain-containing protein [Candidatus Diapherotrites archaeon]|uniref:Carboxypeptidase regulatory-like domain-containing protein n=1 Tax=Candidatus Iainarchaeum sp. TaxID=3101447 RepID=A0A8T4L4L9_9ARCH|nr:carboxypeptidase regulatory-like domain-containing protein [Candidatus Diapherotrites archaeon]
MGIVDGIRGVYFSLEDRYYSFLDALESKGIPVYKVVDPIDSVVPSFPLFVLIVLLLLGGLLWFLVLPNLSFGNAQLNVKVLDFSDSPISGASVTVIRNGTQTIGVSDALGKTAFDFPKGSEIAVSVSREGFDNFEVPAFVLSESREVTARLSTAGSASGEAVIRTIRLLSQSGQPLVGEDITVSFSCSNSAANPPAEVTVTTGEVKVTEPGNCGGLVAQIRSRNFKEVASFPVSQLVNTAYLISNSAALEEDRGTIEVLVTENNQAVSDGLSIVLYPFESDISVDSAPVQNGKAVFSNVAFGKYVVKNRGTSDFAPTSATLTLSSKRQTVSLALQKNVAGKIVVKVIDADTRKPVPNSTVSLRIGNDEVEKKTTSDDGNGSLEFFVPRDTTYNVGVSHPDYCFETRSDLGINKSYSIELEPFTASCGGTIVVKVVDQEGIPVQNALVSLASEQQFFLGAGQEISDLNGVARFAGIKAGTYTAFAFKGTSSGWSDPKFFNRKKGETEQVDLIATLQIPNGIVRIQVVDKENRPVPFATITFVDAFDNQIVGGGAKPADSNGVLSWETRADKTVYAIVEKEGFASVASQWIEVKPSTIQEEQVQLLPPITQFEVELVGLFSGNLSTPPAGSPTASLAAGQEYVARFRIKIPSDRSFSSDHPFNQVGIHVRTGTEGIMEKDFIFLKETNAPSASVVRSTSFTGKYVSDLAAVTSSDAKWANMTWTRPRADVIMAQIVVKVKENAALGKKLDIFYRAWGGQNGDVVRDPADQTGGGQELYSDAKDASFTVGVGTLCDERFCFDASIYDQRDALRMPVTDSFAARNLENYTLSFAIGNTSKMDTDTYRNAELRLEAIEENLLFKQYTIFDAASEGSKPITGTANAAALPRITIGDLSPGRRISGDIAFMPKIPGTHTIDFRIVDTDLGQIVFSKQLSIISIADNDFVIVVSPEKLSPGIENPVIITVTDKVTGLPVKDAFVRLRDKFKNILSTSQTNSLGIVETRLPAQAPGEILDIEVERVEYNTLIKKVTVDGEILTLSPERLGFSVNPKSKPTDAKEFKISNVAPFELAIESVSLSGKFSGLLDLDSTNNALHSWAGAKIKANDFVSISVPVKTSTQATDLEALTDLSGVLTVRVSSQGHAWDFEIPVQITVGLGGEVDDPACLTLSQTEWVSSSQGKPIVLEFSIQNNCSIAGKPVDISNVETRIAWIGNQTGEFELSTDVSNSILRSGYFLTILPKLEAGKSVVARLTFTPNAQVIGSTKATVEFQATNPTDSAPQTLSAQLSADLDVVNLLSCVSYDKEYIEMQAEETFNPKVSAVGFGVSQSINPITGRVTAGDDNSD